MEDDYHKAGNFSKQRYHILNSQKTEHDKYSKKKKGPHILRRKKGPYADLFLYILKKYFTIFIIRLLIRKKILVI